MSDLQLVIEEKSTVIDTVGQSVPRIVVALPFVARGVTKLSSHGVGCTSSIRFGVGQ